MIKSELGNINFVTTGPKFPYSYYLGVMTAMKSQKVPVKLWYTQIPNSRYFDILVDKIEMEQIDVPDFEVFKSLSEHERYVATFDYCALKVLHDHGGTILGLDSITVGDIQGLLEDDKEMLIGIDAESAPGSYCLHGVTVRKNSALIKRAHNESVKIMNGKWMRFGDAGMLPVLKQAWYHPDKITVADYGVLGGYRHDKSKFYLYKTNTKPLSKDVRTIPFYATSRKDLFDSITEELILDSKILLSKLTRKVLTVEEIKPKDRIKEMMDVPFGGRSFRFHLVGLVHLPVSERYMACAFTQKIYKLSKMLLERGHEVYLYGCEGSDVPCTKFIQTHTLEDIRSEWGEGDNRFELGYDWKSKNFKHDINKPRTKTYHKFNSKVIEEINKVKRDDDFLLITQGTYQSAIANSVNLYLTCESGIGYRGSFPKYGKNPTSSKGAPFTNHRAFESAYIQNFTYGSENPRKSINGNHYDRVIPNYFDAKDFKFRDKDQTEDYYVYLGRMITRKGVSTAVKAVEALGGKIKLAGQGIPPIKSKCIDFVGYVNPEERDELIGKAKALFLPTTYLEPFGSTSVEAMLCGTPAITTNFGVFPETILNGVSGYRCDTLMDFIQAARDAPKLNRKRVRKHAEKYLMSNVMLEFDKWFRDLYQLYLSWKFSKEGVKGWNYIEK